MSRDKLEIPKNDPLRHSCKRILAIQREERLKRRTDGKHPQCNDALNGENNLSSTVHDDDDESSRIAQNTDSILFAKFFATNPLLSPYKDFLGRRWGVSQRSRLDYLMMMEILSGYREGKNENRDRTKTF